MTTPESTPTEPIRETPPPQQTTEDIPDIHKALYLMGGNPAKWVTYLALTTFEEGEYASKLALEGRIAKLHEGVEAWTPDSSTLMRYCKTGLKPARLIELGLTDASTYKMKQNQAQLVEAARVNEKARLLGFIVVGALCPIEIDSMQRSETEVDPPLFVQDSIGKAYEKGGRIAGAPTRFAIYDVLLGLPPDEGMAQSELKARTGLPHSSLAMMVQDLTNLGILYKEDDHDHKRMFRLSAELLESRLERLKSTKAKAVVETALSLHKGGATQATAREILDRVAHMNAELSGRRMSKWFIRWIEHPVNASVLQEVTASGNRRHHTRIGIPSYHRDYLRELLRIRRLLVEDSDEAKDFREASIRRAEALLTSPHQLARLLNHAKSRSRQFGPLPGTDWTEDVALLVPGEGISTAQLHKKLEERFGKEIGYRNFRDRLSELPDIIVTGAKGAGRAGRQAGFVRIKKIFPNNWQDDAACRDMDPELFYPIYGAEPPNDYVMRKVEEIKAVCRRCPVKPACLKVVIENGENDAIQGGVWFARRAQELPRERRDFILNTVEIKRR